MKTTLFLQTALPETQVALISEDHFDTQTFSADKAQAEQLFKSIQTLTSKISPQQILVISGPGAFTGLRVGITAGNAIAHALQIPISTLTTFDFLRAQHPGDFPVALPGGHVTLWQSNPDSKITHLTPPQFQAKLKSNSKIITSPLLDLPPNQSLLPQPMTKSLLQTLLQKSLNWQTQITPDYFREPHITPKKQK